MTTPIRTAEQAIAWQQARLGLSRLDKQADWDAGPTIDDCALFQSQAVFGSWVAWNVDVLTGFGTYTPGKAGIQRGDFVLFDWDGDGIGDHVEMALESPRADGSFQTIGANRDATFKVKTGSRNGSVKGHVRPAYKTSATPANPATPAPPATPIPEEEHRMYWLARDKATKGQGTIFIIDGVKGTKKPLTSALRLVQNAAEALGGDKHPVAEVAAATLTAIPDAK
jgi:hypothetical protein